MVELGNWSAITCRKGVHEDCVRYVVVESTLTWVNAVDFGELLESFLCSRLLFGSVVVCHVFVEGNPYCKLVKDVAWGTRSWTVAFSSSFSMSLRCV